MDLKRELQVSIDAADAGYEAGVADERRRWEPVVRQMEDALRDILGHVRDLREALPLRDTRENHEYLLAAGSRARAALAALSAARQGQAS